MSHKLTSKQCFITFRNNMHFLLIGQLRRRKYSFFTISKLPGFHIAIIDIQRCFDPRKTSYLYAFARKLTYLVTYEEE